MKLEMVNGAPVVVLDQPNDLPDLAQALERGTRQTEWSSPAATALYYQLLAVQAQKIIEHG